MDFSEAHLAGWMSEWITKLITSFLSNKYHTSQGRIPREGLLGTLHIQLPFRYTAIFSMEPCDKRTNNSSLFTTLFNPRISPSLHTDRTVIQVLRTEIGSSKSLRRSSVCLTCLLELLGIVPDDNPIHYRQLSTTRAGRCPAHVHPQFSRIAIASAKERSRHTLILPPE